MIAKYKNFYVFGGLLVIIIGMMLVIILKDNDQQKKPQGNPTMPANTVSANAVIAKVGAENMYQKDYDREEKAYPKIPNTNIKDILIKKMIKDSKILQAAEKEGLITLDATIYNSPDKDYQKRIKKVMEVEELVQKRQEKIKGSVISVWCYNNSKPPEIDLEEAKEIAFKKISSLHSTVKTKQMTIKQAAQAIQSDETLVTIDIAYKANAIFEFEAGPNETISFDKTFDTKVRQLQPGEVSEIYLAKDMDLKTKEPRDAVYMFAQVDGKTSGVKEDFEAWYAQKEKDYAVQIY